MVNKKVPLVKRISERGGYWEVEIFDPQRHTTTLKTVNYLAFRDYIMETLFYGWMYSDQIKKADAYIKNQPEDAMEHLKTYVLDKL